MKKKTVILLIIFLVILIAGGIFARKYWNYFSAFYYVATQNSDKLVEKKEETDQKAIDTIKEYGIETVRPLSEEESSKLNSGELTEEEAVNIILGKTDNGTEASTEITQNQENNQVVNSEQQKLQEKNEEIAQLIGKVYVLKAKFTGELDKIEKWVHEEYRKLSSEEKKSTSAKVKIGRSAYSKALALQSDCDAQMEEIFGRLTVLLKETGQSTALVDEIRAAYENEKKVKISYYMDKI